MSLKKNIFLFCQCIITFSFFHLGKGMAIHLKKIDTPSHKDALPSMVEIGSVVLEKKIFKFCQYIFTISLSLALRLTNLITLHPCMLCAKFGWNRSSGYGEEDENVKSYRQRQQRRPLRTTDKLRSDKQIKANFIYLLFTYWFHDIPDLLVNCTKFDRDLTCKAYSIIRLF